MIKLRTTRWAWHVARMGDKRVAYRILMGRHGIKRKFEGPKHGWEGKY